MATKYEFTNTPTLTIKLVAIIMSTFAQTLIVTW